MAADNDASNDAPFDEFRTGYIKGRWDVSKNCARAFQLFELGYSVSGATKILPVTAPTVRSYRNELCEKIGDDAVGAVTSSKRRYDVFGDRSADEYGKLSYEDGLEQGRAARNQPVTTSSDQLDPYFSEQQTELNRGTPLAEIDPSLVTVSW